MRGVYTVAEIRPAESALMGELSDGALMMRAAFALSIQCERLLGRVYGARVVLLVGSGNNGGDALFAGARLAGLGASVRAVLLDPARAHAAGLAAFRRSGGRVVTAPVTDPGSPGGSVGPAAPAAPAAPAVIDAAWLDGAGLLGADLVVDGILGIGGSGGLREPAAGLVAALAGALTVAVDLPSGVDADTGVVAGAAVSADVTVSFGALKAGLVVGDGAERSGEVHVADIGLDPFLPTATTLVLEAHDIAAALPQPGVADDKYTRGVVGVIAGSPAYPGAGVLATGSALHGGAGMVRYLGLAPEQIRARYPEVVSHPGVRPSDVRVQSWVVGPGLGTDDAAAALVAEVLATDVPVVLDADAITIVARTPELLRNRNAATVLTPHDREFVRLPVSLDADRLGSARRAAAELGVILLLKGSATVVAAPDGIAYINTTGTPWLATAGSGDVLSGLLGSLLATGLDAALAAAVGAHLHGLAGQLAAASGPPSASDILAAIRPAIRAVHT